MDSILLVGNFLSGSGLSTSTVRSLADRLNQMGLSIITTSEKIGRLARVADMVLTAKKMRLRFDVAYVEVYSGRAFFWAEAVCWMLRRLHKPYVLALHGGLLPKFGARWPNRVKRLLRSAATVTAPSRYLKDEMAAYRSDIQVIPNGLDLSAYEFRLRAHVTPRLMWLRSFHEIYNPVMAVRVLAILRQRWPDISLLMVGPDKKDGSLQHLEAVAQELGVKRHIEIRGLVPKRLIPNVLQEGDIFINTTNADNTPVSVIEAMACGLCVVSTSVGGIPYLLTNEHDALLVPIDDAAGMASCVDSLITDALLAEHLSSRGRALAETCDWQVVAPQWVEILRQATPC